VRSTSFAVIVSRLFNRTDKNFNPAKKFVTSPAMNWAFFRLLAAEVGLIKRAWILTWAVFDWLW
jgi:hypothetical protein